TPVPAAVAPVAPTATPVAPAAVAAQVPATTPVAPVPVEPAIVAPVEPSVPAQPEPEVHADSELPPSGWYPDPYGTARLRWWDGTGWTSHAAE
ncbi:MAG TPA: DUF2510 domain-containing protein, partial [Acidimicrobiales bacterium]|nr:DUF2510 domain-containing protein [Acidimicrobiales bacterium]